MIWTFHFIRILNPITHWNFQKTLIVPQKSDIYSDWIEAKLTFVVTKWWQDVTWKLWCFSAHERGDFSRNSGVLQCTKMESFFEEFWHFATRWKGDFLVRLMGWWDWFERVWQWRENLSKRFTSTAKNTTEVCQKVLYGIHIAKMIQLAACGKFT